MKRRSSSFNPLSRVHYRPIEAAIRWCGLTRREHCILKIMRRRNVQIPEPDDFPQWPALRLNTERIYDAILHNELPYGKNGVTLRDDSVLDDPDLTIRHVDLKEWMTRCYPDQRPAFLFSRLERELLPRIALDSINAILAEREILLIQLAHMRKEALQQKELSNLSAKNHISTSPPTSADPLLSTRSEVTYLNIIGGLLTLILGQSPSGTRHSVFQSQQSVISALLAHHEGRLGISARTLEAKFAAAKRSLTSR